MTFESDPFDLDFVAPTDWARMYRSHRLQAVPCHMPRPGFQWKRPALAHWKIFHDNLVTDAQFDQWYGVGGEHVRRINMGLITGRCSGNIFVIDLDDHKTPEAHTWWQGTLEARNHGFEPETWQQRTGGGGRQLFFRAPPDWVAPTNRTPIGVDIRGQGGFAVMPPSVHDSGRCYEWVEGCAPWDGDAALAEEWLLEAVGSLVERFGGSEHTKGTRRTESPDDDFNAFGTRVDGREDYMTRLIWATLIDLRADSPIPPLTLNEAKAAYDVYERAVKPRIQDPSASKRELLDREGRGYGLFMAKWGRAMEKWDDEIAVEGEKKQKIYDEKPKNCLVLSSSEFDDRFIPPNYLVSGLIQRRFMYSLTAATGCGKTAIALLLMICVCLGKKFCNLSTKKGNVLYFAGENPDDILYRWIALTQRNGALTPKDINNAWFIPGVFKLSEIIDRVADEMKSRPLALVIIDTTAAYFEGDDENSNAQLGAHARRMRTLCNLPGGPCIIINSHPVKHAQPDNLLPRGGGAFLAEVDGNLTCKKTDSSVEVHWQGKFRGPDFSPLHFLLQTVTHERLVDTDGMLVPTVIAEALSEDGAEEIKTRTRVSEDMVLVSIVRKENMSLRARAVELGWLMSDGQPYTIKVSRALHGLLAEGLVRKSRGNWIATDKGKKEAKQLKDWPEEGDAE